MKILSQNTKEKQTIKTLYYKQPNATPNNPLPLHWSLFNFQNRWSTIIWMWVIIPWEISLKIPQLFQKK